MERLRYPIRTVVGLVVASVLSLYAMLSFYGDQSDRNRAQPDPYQVATQKDRFDGLKGEMRSPLVIGYVTDVPFQSGIFLAVQYVLAPLLLVDNPGPDWVVGDFSKPMDYADFGRARRLTLVKDFSNGVVLFKKAAQ